MNIDLNHIKVSFDYMDGEAEDIKRCLETLYQTVEGTCPLDRAFGLKQDLIDLPLNVAQNELALELIEKTEKYESRVTVKDVLFDVNKDGRMQVEVIVTNG